MSISNKLFDWPEADRPSAKPARQRNHPSQYLFVRKVKGFKYQARAWLPSPLGSINIGLHPSEREAWMAVKAWLKAGGNPLKGLPAGVLPKWVRRTNRGRFLGRLKGADGVVVIGPFRTPEEAHRAVLASFAEGRPDFRRYFQPTLLEVVG